VKASALWRKRHGVKRRLISPVVRVFLWKPLAKSLLVRAPSGSPRRGSSAGPAGLDLDNCRVGKETHGPAGRKKECKASCLTLPSASLTGELCRDAGSVQHDLRIMRSRDRTVSYTARLIVKLTAALP